MGWVFILMAGIVLRQVSRGRVMETPQDLSDAFLAIVSNDTAKLKEVFSRTGDFTTPDKAEEIDLGEGTFSGAKVAGDTYNLGAKTKSHVRAVANRLGPMFGIKTVGGWRAVGSVPNSAHPKGLALDFMIDNIPNGKSIGQKLADYAVANASTLGIIEVIWNRRIWTASKGWHDYNGPSAHTDHVHLTFKDK
jgi:hypothetical protein